MLDYRPSYSSSHGLAIAFKSQLLSFRLIPADTISQSMVENSSSQHSFLHAFLTNVNVNVTD